MSFLVGQINENTSKNYDCRFLEPPGSPWTSVPVRHHPWFDIVNNGISQRCQFISYLIRKRDYIYKLCGCSHALQYMNRLPTLTCHRAANLVLFLNRSYLKPSEYCLMPDIGIQTKIVFDTPAHGQLDYITAARRCTLRTHSEVDVVGINR